MGDPGEYPSQTGSWIILTVKSEPIAGNPGFQTKWNEFKEYSGKPGYSDNPGSILSLLVFATVPPSKPRIFGLEAQFLEPRNIFVVLGVSFFYPDLRGRLKKNKKNTNN